MTVKFMIFFLNNKMCFILLRILYIIRQRFEFFFFPNRHLSNLSFLEIQNFPKTSLNFLTVRLFLTILTFTRIVKIITRIPIQISKASFGQSTKNNIRKSGHPVIFHKHGLYMQVKPRPLAMLYSLIARRRFGPQSQ